MQAIPNGIYPGMQGWFNVWLSISMKRLNKETPMIMSMKKKHLTNSNSPIHTKTFQKKKKKKNRWNILNLRKSIYPKLTTMLYLMVQDWMLFFGEACLLGSQLQLFHGQRKPWGGQSGLRFELWKLTKLTNCRSLGGKVPMKSWPLRLLENSPLYGRARKSHCGR